MFPRLVIDRTLFDEALALVRDVAAHRRSGRAFDRNGLFFIIESFPTVLMGPRVLSKKACFIVSIQI